MDVTTDPDLGVSLVLGPGIIGVDTGTGPVVERDRGIGVGAGDLRLEKREDYLVMTVTFQEGIDIQEVLK